METVSEVPGSREGEGLRRSGQEAQEEVQPGTEV